MKMEEEMSSRERGKEGDVELETNSLSSSSGFGGSSSGGIEITEGAKWETLV